MTKDIAFFLLIPKGLGALAYLSSHLPVIQILRSYSPAFCRNARCTIFMLSQNILIRLPFGKPPVKEILQFPQAAFSIVLF